MTIRFLITILLFALGLASGPARADHTVTCVQAQLNALGYDAGQADGFIGPLTKSAYRKFQKDRGDQAFSFALKGAKYLVLCRELGIEDPELANHWPMQGRRMNVGSDGSLLAETVAGIEALALQNIAELDRLGFGPLAERIELVAGTNQAVLSVFARSELRENYDREVYQAAFAEACPEGADVCAFAVNSVITLCLKAGVLVLDQSTEARIKTALKGAMMRVYQSQLLGHAPERQGQKFLASHGPYWLWAGMPLAYMNSALAEEPTGNLASFEMPPESAASQDDLSRMGAAPARLGTGSDMRSVLEFYRHLGLGQDWAEAFEASFGQSVAGFYLSAGN
jgi:hypothetical protein